MILGEIYPPPIASYNTVKVFFIFQSETFYIGLWFFEYFFSFVYLQEEEDAAALFTPLATRLGLG